MVARSRIPTERALVALIASSALPPCAVKLLQGHQPVSLSRSRRERDDVLAAQAASRARRALSRTARRRIRPASGSRSDAACTRHGPATAFAGRRTLAIPLVRQAMSTSAPSRELPSEQCHAMRRLGANEREQASRKGNVWWSRVRPRKFRCVTARVREGRLCRGPSVRGRQGDRRACSGIARPVEQRSQSRV